MMVKPIQVLKAAPYKDVQPHPIIEFFENANEYARELQAIRTVRGSRAKAPRIPIEICRSARDAGVSLERFVSALGVARSTAHTATKRFGIDLSKISREIQIADAPTPTDPIASKIMEAIQMDENSKSIQHTVFFETQSEPTNARKPKSERRSSSQIRSDVRAGIACFIESERKIPSVNQVRLLVGITHATAQREWPTETEIEKMWSETLGVGMQSEVIVSGNSAIPKAASYQGTSGEPNIMEHLVDGAIRTPEGDWHCDRLENREGGWYPMVYVWKAASHPPQA